MEQSNPGMMMATGEWRKLSHQEGVRIAREAEKMEIDDSPEVFLRGLKFMRYECLDDLPAEKLKPEDPNYQLYKCRTSWIMSLFNRLQEAQLNGYLKNPVTKEKIKKLHSFLFNIHKNEKMRTHEDIAFFNDVLDTAISEMHQNLGLLQ